MPLHDDVLDGGRTVTVTREEDHQAVLGRYPLGRATVELGFCVVGEGRYRGERAVEVLLGGERVGELTFRMSERYAALVGAVRAAGGVPRCAATLTAGARGRQVELLLPAPEQLDAVVRRFAQVGVGAGSGGAVSASGGAVPVREIEPVTVPFPRRGAPAPRVPGAPGSRPDAGSPATALVPGQRRSVDPVPAGPSTPGPRPSPTVALPGPRPPALPGPRRPERSRRSKRPWFVAGGVALLVAGIVGVVNSGGEGSTTSAAPTRTTTSANPPATTAPPAVAPDTTPPAATPGASGDTAVAGSGSGTTRAVNPPAAPQVAAPVTRTTRAAAPTTTVRAAAPPPAAVAPASGCHPSYTPCVPNSSKDLNCKDVGKKVTIIGPDEYGLDGNDNDGLGCESYP